MKESVQAGVDAKFKSNVREMRNCLVCDSFTESTKEFSIVTAGSVLIVQLERFEYVDGKPLRKGNAVECLLSSNNWDLDVTVFDSDPEISFSNRYSLVSTINHSGTLSKGHYTSYNLI